MCITRGTTITGNRNTVVTGTVDMGIATGATIGMGIGTGTDTDTAITRVIGSVAISGNTIAVTRDATTTRHPPLGDTRTVVIAIRTKRGALISTSTIVCFSNALEAASNSNRRAPVQNVSG